MRGTIAALLGALVGLSAMHPPAGAAQLQVETVAEGLEFPWSIAFMPDGDALITERSGGLRRLADGVLSEPLAGLPEVFVAGQGGLMEVLIDPQFEANQRVYLSYAHGDGDANATRVARATLVDNALSDLEVVYTARPWKDTPVHYGGRMCWAADGTLMLGLGDGFDYREAAQDLSSALGKIVRIHADGVIPEDNPLRDRNGALAEIYSYGHRNVQGMVCDTANNRILAHEHGPRGGDELNRIVAGANYGWPLATFGLDYSGAQISPFTELERTRPPLLHWTPSIAPSGMAMVSGAMFADWEGDLLVTALAAKMLVRVRLDGRRVVEQEELLVDLDERLRDVRMAPDGAIYVLTDSVRGRVLRVSR